MLKITFEYKPINTEQLEREMREVFQKRYNGYSTNGLKEITFFLEEPIEKTDEEILTGLYLAHVPEVTDEQVRENLDLQIKLAYQLLQEFDPEAVKRSENPVDTLIDLFAAFRLVLLGL